MGLAVLGSTTCRPDTTSVHTYYFGFNLVALLVDVAELVVQCPLLFLFLFSNLLKRPCMCKLGRMQGQTQLSGKAERPPEVAVDGKPPPSQTPVTLPFGQCVVRWNGRRQTELGTMPKAQ